MLRKDGVEHAERVYSAVRWAEPSAPLNPDKARLMRSWERSLEGYGLDPGRTAQPRILTGSGLRERQESLETFLRIARCGVRSLYGHVRDANYVVLLTDPEGVTLDFVGQPSLDKELKKAGLYLGSVWTESEEGTCGVGTSIVERTPITVHKREHFRAPNTTLTCSAAPVFDLDGSVRAILDASALYSPDDRKSQNLVLKFVVLAADMIENAHFLDRCKHAWVLQLSRSAEFLQVQTDYLVAFDESGTVLAMNRRAQTELMPPQPKARAARELSVAALFDTRVSDLLQRARANAPCLLRARGSGQNYFAQIQAPVGNARSITVPAPPRAYASMQKRVPAAKTKRSAAERVDASGTVSNTHLSMLPSTLSINSKDGILHQVSEKERLVAALRQHCWHVAAAARQLQISRATLYRKLHKHGIVSPNQRDAQPDS